MNTLITPSNLVNNAYRRNWLHALWFNFTFGLTVVLSIFVGAMSDVPFTYLFGQMFLSLSAYFSFYILGDRPLFNPIQSFIVLFYWWFNIAPTVCGGFYLLLSLPDQALLAQTSGSESLWIVAAGLPLYAIAARYTLVFMAQKGIYARFLLPEDRSYKTKTVVYFLLAGFSAQILLFMLSYNGIEGRETINYFGGEKTTIWWVGVIAGITLLSQITNSILVTELVRPWKSVDVVIKIMCIIVVLHTIYGALIGGWKSAFVFLFFYIMCAYVSKHQTLPWRSLFIFIFAYLFIIEPFVSTGRALAENYNISTVSERESIFSELIGSGDFKGESSFKDIKIESPFRGIYPLAGDITRNNNFFDGEWNGHTIEWGLGILVPRLLNPDKPDMNIGNFFYKTTYARTYNENVVSDINNIAISLPFEFVGNYGWIARILSFMLIGIFWAGLCGWLLSVPRLSNHPLSPFLIGFTLGMEAPLGHFLAILKGLLIPFAVIYIIRMLLKGKL